MLRTHHNTPPVSGALCLSCPLGCFPVLATLSEQLSGKDRVYCKTGGASLTGRRNSSLQQGQLPLELCELAPRHRAEQGRERWGHERHPPGQKLVSLPCRLCLLLPHGLQEGQFLGFLLLIPGFVLQPGSDRYKLGLSNTGSCPPPTQPEWVGNTPVLDNPLHNQVCSEVATTVDLTEDSSSLGLLEASMQREEGGEKPDYKHTPGAPPPMGGQYQREWLFLLPRGSPGRGNPPGRGQSHPCQVQFLSSHDILGPPGGGSRVRRPPQRSYATTDNHLGLAQT